MINYEKVAQKIFSTIKGHGHDLIMFTDEGMETSNAEEARRFFVKKPNYMVTLDGENRHIKINKNSNVSLEDIEGIMKQLKNLATSNMLKTEIRVFGKEITPKDFAYQAKNLKEPTMREAKEDWGKKGSIWDKNGECKYCKHWEDGFDPRPKTYGNLCAKCGGDGMDFEGHRIGIKDRATGKIRRLKNTGPLESVTEASFSRMHGFKKTSYQTLESTKIVVRHRKPIDEEVRGSRARNIQAIFIEHAGERFRFPHNNLAGARAMARHINEGGNMQDAIGQYIIESITNYNKLMEFVRYARTNKLINENSEDIIKTIRESVGVIRREIGQLQGAKTYGPMSETIQTREPNVIEEEDTAELRDMFTVRKFDEQMGDILPIVKKLMDTKQVWRNALVEASEKEIAISEKSNLSETDVFEFDNPMQSMGYKVKDIADRMIGESDLQTFVGKVAGKLIEGEQISAFEKKVVGNVLGNAVVREEEEICEGCGEIRESCKCGPKDVVELISDSFDLRMKMIEHEDIFTEDAPTKRDCPECGDFSMDLADKHGDDLHYVCNTCGHEESDQLIELPNRIPCPSCGDFSYYMDSAICDTCGYSEDDLVAMGESKKVVNENFPKHPQSEWWKNDPDELLTYMYWINRQIPPADKDAAWEKVKAQLSKKNPPPEGVNPMLGDGPLQEAEGDKCIRCRKGTMEAGDTFFGPAERCNRCGYQRELAEADDHHADEVAAGAHSGMPSESKPYDRAADVAELADQVIDDLAGEFDDPDVILRAVHQVCGGDPLFVDDVYQEVLDRVNYQDPDDGQPTEYEEWQDYMGGDDWDFGQYDESIAEMRRLAGIENVSEGIGDWMADKMLNMLYKRFENEGPEACALEIVKEGKTESLTRILRDWQLRNMEKELGSDKYMFFVKVSALLKKADGVMSETADPAAANECPECKGDGNDPLSIFDDDDCPECGGTGEVE